MSDLKPCPCCGGQPTAKTGVPGCAWIKCECGIETTDGSLPRVIGIWNTRAKPKVKPLVWSHWSTHKTTGRKTWKAYGVGVTYVVRETAAGVSADFGLIHLNFSTVDEAQAAAQADYERRILEALE